jgi:hypothetical protein
MLIWLTIAHVLQADRNPIWAQHLLRRLKRELLCLEGLFALLDRLLDISVFVVLIGLRLRLWLRSIIRHFRIGQVLLADS